MAVERSQRAAQPAQVEDGIDLAQQMIRRHPILEIEGIKQPILPANSRPHHCPDPPLSVPVQGITVGQAAQSSSSTVSAKRRNLDETRRNKNTV